MVSNSDKTQVDYSLALTLDTDGVILIFLDNRIPAGNNTTPAAPGGGVMDWVVDMGFTDTCLDIGVGCPVDSTRLAVPLRGPESVLV